MQLAFFSVLEKSHIINPLLTKLVRSRWQDIGLVLFCVFMDLDFVSVHKHAKKELGQYPAILTSRLVNNPYFFIIISDKYFGLLICSKLVLRLTILCLFSVEKVTEGQEVQEKIVKGWTER